MIGPADYTFSFFILQDFLSSLINFLGWHMIDFSAAPGLRGVHWRAEREQRTESVMMIADFQPEMNDDDDWDNNFNT